MSDHNYSDLQDWVQVDAETHYSPEEYLTPARLASIGYQIHYVNQHFKGESLLEVGVGTGVAANFFRQMGHDVSTLDVDPKLSPTVLGSVTEIPQSDASYGCFVCCQVLEHLPWNDAKTAMKELRRVVSKGGIISVPTVRSRTGIRLFPYKKRARTLMLPGIWGNSRTLHCPGQHEWELGVGVSLKDFTAALQDAGFEIVEQRQPIENPYHHFFVLQSIGG